MSKRKKSRSAFPRRDFLKLGGAAAAGMVAQTAWPRAAEAMRALPATSRAMATRNLGSTGYRVGLFSLGGQSAIEQADNYDIAVPLIERAIDLGVNYLDTAAQYGGPRRWSQRHLGEVMKNRRSEVFLATKTHDRSRDGSWRLLEESLKLLRTSHLDLWQVHHLNTMDEVDRIFAPDGAMKALLEARQQGIVRHLGVTGHRDPFVLAEAIRRFSFDTILMAVNAADKHHLSFIEHLLPLAVEKEMGIIGMKIPARGLLLSSFKPGEQDRRRRWERGSKPGTLDMKQALRYVLSLPVSTVIVGCDNIAQLEENAEIARTFTPLTGEQLASLESLAEPVHRQALFFRRWA